MRNEIAGDVLILIGLAMMGSGLWMLHGLEAVLILVGALLFVLGTMLALRGDLR